MMSHAGHAWDCLHPDTRNSFQVDFMKSIVKYTHFSLPADFMTVQMCVFFILTFFIKNICCPGKELDDSKTVR